MPKYSEFGGKREQKDVIIAEMRQKPGMGRAIFVQLLGVEWVMVNSEW